MNELRISQADYRQLHGHLFRADHDEHGAILLAGGYRRSNGSVVLAVRELHLLSAEEFPPGEHGYRQLAASALARLGNRAAEEGLSLVTAHSHPGSRERTGLSADDRAAHERIFGHLLDISGAGQVAGIAFGEYSAAGEIWSSDGTRSALDRVCVVGANSELLYPSPPRRGATAAPRFDRQVRLFGDAGQARLRELNVAVIGLGGGGSILVEQLAHLGVGKLTLVDHDVVKTHNLSRIIAATERDVQHQTKKVVVAARNVKQIDPKIAVDEIDGDISDIAIAERLLDCDYMFLATDTATARLVANAIAQTFLIPLTQIGAKVDTNTAGEIEQIYTAVRPVLPRRGCLHCAGLIDADALQREILSPEERGNQNYLGDPEIIDPSVTTLNAAAAAGALNVFLMGAIGQASDELVEHRITLTRDGAALEPRVAAQEECRWCGTTPPSRYARADLTLLPLRQLPGSATANSRGGFRLLHRLRRLIRR
jgi:hypothetical protein